MTTESDEQPIEIYQLRFWFVGVQPIVWRRLLIRSDQTLADLHYAIQICCSWSDYYLHQFKIHGKTYGVPRLHGVCYTQSAQSVRLSDLRLRLNERFPYEYNFFVNWLLEIRLEKRCIYEQGRNYPICIGGKGAAPPEDCGGPLHFNELRSHYSPFFIWAQLVEYYEMYQRLDELTQDEKYELEDRESGLRRLAYWINIDKFKRRPVNQLLKKYATNDESWWEVEEVSW